MINIDFDKADRIANSINELSSDCKEAIAAGKSVDASRVSSFSPGTAAATAKMQSVMSGISGSINVFNTYYTACISKYRAAYEETATNVNQIKTMNKTTKSGFSNGKVVGTSSDGKMLKVNFNGKEYFVANTEINCLDYETFVKSNGTYQGNGVGAYQCQTLAQVYAVDMLRGTKTTANQIENKNGLSWSPYIRMSNTVKSSNSTQPITDFTYNELKAGRPVALQVSQINSEFGERHWVTVVGFDSSVQSAKDLNADTMLVLDCVDGDIQTLSQSRSTGGHERDLYRWNGVYQVNGATSNFLNTEVNNKG